MLSVQPVVEGKDGMTGLGTDGLDRVRVAFREVPEIARTIVCDFRFPLRINDGHLAMAPQDVRQLSRVVPMHLADTTRVQIQLGAGISVAYRQPLGRDVGSPPPGGCLIRGLRVR